MNSMNRTMQQAMRLMREGDLAAATRTLQHRLGADLPAAGNPRAAPFASDPSDPSDAAAASNDANCIDGEFVVVEDDDRPIEWRSPRVDGVDSAFLQQHFSSSAGALDYKIFVPAPVDDRRAPLLLMLHGCTQTADDFALGTRMNQHARDHGYVVAWPQQSATRNRNRCWNWFRSSDQQRERGEPAMLAALTSHLIEQHGLDPRRVYVAGLSAGGAMAAVLAHTHPDIYAAIGVHSGLPIGLATDVPSAFAAMRTAEAKVRGRGVEATHARVPAIVFHGDADTTVHPRNGEGLIIQSLGGTATADAANCAPTIERGISDGGRRFTRTLHVQSGRVCAEHWVTHGAAHAWSGGDPGGSYTDPSGPDASAQMLRFFETCVQSERG
jgi:poly(hydroxyalkanoate) depolymerase family esterase